MSNPENPPAFPNAHDNGWAEGMTLRDWFAGQALAGLAGCVRTVPKRANETQEQADARWCLSRAAAMPAARKDTP